MTPRAPPADASTRPARAGWLWPLHAPDPLGAEPTPARRIEPVKSTATPMAEFERRQARLRKELGDP